MCQMPPQITLVSKMIITRHLPWNPSRGSPVKTVVNVFMAMCVKWPWVN